MFISTCYYKTFSHEIKCKNKDSIDLSFVENKKIDYTIVMASCMGRDFGSIVMMSFTEEELNILEKIDKKTWLKLIEDTNTDFNANLILYFLHYRCATVLRVFDNLDSNEKIDMWRAIMKKDEIEYWKQYLKE